MHLRGNMRQAIAIILLTLASCNSELDDTTPLHNQINHMHRPVFVEHCKGLHKSSLQSLAYFINDVDLTNVVSYDGLNVLP